MSPIRQYRTARHLYPCTTRKAKPLTHCVSYLAFATQLNYATKNRAEWNIRGHEIVAEMLQDYNESTAIDFIVAHESDDAL